VSAAPSIARPSFPREKVTAASRLRGGTLVVVFSITDVLRLVSGFRKISEKLVHAQTIDTRLSLPPPHKSLGTRLERNTIGREAIAIDISKQHKNERPTLFLHC